MNFAQMRHGSGYYGYTFVELIVIITIMAMGATLAVPAVANLVMHYRLMTTAWEMASNIRLVQQRVITESQTLYKVKFILDKDYYRLYLDAHNPMLYQRINLPDGVSFEMSTLGPPGSYAHELTFTTSGVPSGGGTVVLRSSKGEAYYVIVAPVTGRVRVSTEPPEDW